MTTWNINLLGEFSIYAGDQEIRLPGKKHQALVAYVVTQAECTASREKLLDLLWGSRSDSQAKQSLRGVLSETNKVFDAFANRLNISSPLTADRTKISLDSQLLLTDVENLYDVAKSDCVNQKITYARGGSGEFLENLKINERSFQSWRLNEAARHQRAYRDLLHELISGFNVGRDTEKIVEVADLLISIDEADEVAHQALMKYYAHQGRQSLAIRQFEFCRQRLQSGLGVSPSSTTLDLLAEIKSELPPSPQFATPSSIVTPTKPTKSAVLGVAVAIKPFTATGKDTDGVEYGIILAEEIVSAVSCFKWFRVIPRNESFKSSLAELGPVDVSNALGARYIVEGRMRLFEDTDGTAKYGLTIDMTDGDSSDTVWSERFVMDLSELPYSTRTIARITSLINVRLRENEISRAYQIDTDNLTAYECALLALSNMYNLTPSSYNDAEKYFTQGVALNPDYSFIHSFWCMWKMFCVGQGWSKDKAADLTFISTLARRAIQLDPSNAIALAISGQFESFWHQDFRLGMRKFEQALSSNPYSSFSWMLSSATYSYYGEPDEALRRLEKASELGAVESPLEFMYDCAYCVAYLFAEDYKQAAEWGYKTITENPGFTNGYKLLLIALGHLERKDEAANVLTQLLKLDSDFNVRDYIATYPIHRNADRERFQYGLIAAGVPLTAARSETH